MSRAEEQQDQRSEFHQAVFSVLNAHSRLDYNLGLCLSFLMEPADPRAAYPRIEKLSSAQKIEELGKAVVGSPCESEFDAWSKGAASVRAVRNRFAHGIWEFLPRSGGKPVRLRSPPWISDQPEDKVWNLTIDEVEAMASEVETFLGDFMAWRHRFKV